MGSLSIMSGGEEVYSNSFGYANAEENVKASGKTKYRIGSISKTFTATLIMQLIDEGKLSLDTKLSEFFPQIPNAETITIEQLLRHRSGLYNFTNAPDYEEWMVNPKTENDLIELFVANGVIFEPGAKNEYSNTNYVLLGFILEKLEKKPMAEILKQRIVEPAGLTDTYYGGKIGSMENEAFSYSRGDGWIPEKETDMSIPHGAGAIVSTPKDINLFLRKLFTSDLVSKESLEKMKTMTDGYGIGMFVIPFNDHTSYGHTGGIDGFRSMASYFPEEDLAVAYTSNAAVYAPNSIMIGVLSIYFGNEYTMPVFLKVSKEVLESYGGTYATPQLPIDLTVYNEGERLFAQATNQPPFPLEAVQENVFQFVPAGLVIEFMPQENKLILKQGGMTYQMIKK